MEARNSFSGMSCGLMGSRVGGQMGGWIKWKSTQLSRQLGWVEAGTEISNTLMKRIE